MLIEILSVMEIIEAVKFSIPMIGLSIIKDAVINMETHRFMGLDPCYSI